MLLHGPTIRNTFIQNEEVLMPVMPEEAGRAKDPEPDDPGQFLTTRTNPTPDTESEIPLPNFE